MKYLWIYVTHPDLQSAEQVAQSLLEKRLIACANISSPVTSLYTWQGKLEKETEVILVMKTQEKHFVEIQKCIEAIHPYQCPCILALPIEKGNSAYLSWIGESTS